MIGALTALAFRPQRVVNLLMHIDLVELGDVDLGFLRLTVATQGCDTAEGMCV